MFRWFQPATVYSLSILLGLWLGLQSVALPLWLSAVVMPLVLVKSGRVVALVFCLLIFSSMRANAVASALNWQSLAGERVAVVGTIDSPPVTDYKYKPLQSKAKLKLESISGRRAVGTMRIKTLFLPANLGDRVMASGKLREFKGSYSISFAKVEMIQANQNPLLNLRLQTEARLRSLLPDRAASLAVGFLIGGEAVDEADRELFRTAGLVHIISVSGFNLTFVARALRRLTVPFGWRFGFVIAVLGASAYALAVGLSPAVLRALVTSLLLIGAGFIGRRFHPLSLILLTAAVSALVQPQVLLGSLSWQLSLAGFTGVVLLQPILLGRRRGLLVTTLLETLAASLMVLPILLVNGGSTLLYLLPANLLVVPLIAAAMLLAALIVVLGWIPLIASLLVFGFTQLSNYIYAVVTFINQLPGADALFSLGWSQLIVWYGGCTLLLLRSQSFDSSRLIE